MVGLAEPFCQTHHSHAGEGHVVELLVVQAGRQLEEVQRVELDLVAVQVDELFQLSSHSCLHPTVDRGADTL